MRELVLVLPDLFLRGAAPASVVGGSLTSLRFAAPRLMRGGWRGTVARGAGRDDLTLVDEASVIDAALRMGEGAKDLERGSATEMGEAWIATPVHLMAGLKTLHFPANGVLHLAADEAAELAAAFSSTFGDDGLSLHPASAAGFVLRGLSAPGALTVEPARLIGDSLETHLPSGPGSVELRALASEVEMWLHGLPLNERRQSRGEPVISSLWLWGGGQPPRDALRASVVSSRWSQIVTDDVWARSLARLTGVPVAPLPESINEMFDAIDASDADASVLVIAPLTGLDSERFDRAFVAPVARALESERLGRFTVAANDRWATVGPRDRYRLWRPHRTVFTAVADGGA
ncbi:MAG: hypothetical protein ACKO42_03930 [Gammaproteobacteria bacterium]